MIAREHIGHLPDRYLLCPVPYYGKYRKKPEGKPDFSFMLPSMKQIRKTVMLIINAVKNIPFPYIQDKNQPQYNECKD